MPGFVLVMAALCAFVMGRMFSGIAGDVCVVVGFALSVTAFVTQAVGVFVRARRQADLDAG